MKKAIIFQGGWDGHEPELTTARFQRVLEGEGFAVERYDTLDCLADEERLETFDLIVPCWTGGDLPDPYVKNVARAVGRGTGIAGWHGGMCDAFRQSTEWQFITGGQWVSHPGGDGVEYVVNVRRGSSPIVDGIEDFTVWSEHYYLQVLATTRFPLVNYFHSSNKVIDMPVVWTKYWGNGRVFYSSLGHHDEVFDRSPSAQELMRRGMLWAADGKRIAAERGLTTERFENTAKMY